MNHFWGHLKTITKHRHAVFLLCCKCGIPLQGLMHDLSKYSPAEFIPGVRFWKGTESPQVSERKAYGYSPAWLHHKGRNKHHFEYWSDYVEGKGTVPIEMPPKYFAEMICDRIAACKIYLGDRYNDSSALEYYERVKTRYFINENTSRDLEQILRYLAENGEERTMEYLKKHFVERS